jgi:hypothetical protein
MVCSSLDAEAGALAAGLVPMNASAPITKRTFETMFISTPINDTIRTNEQ